MRRFAAAKVRISKIREMHLFLTFAFLGFNEIQYDKLYPSGSAHARIYGANKMHKFSTSDLFSKLCPLVSSIDTFDYNLAGFLCDLLSPLVSNDYTCKDNFSFVSQIKNGNLSKKFIVSYNVTSLFTNIPLQETIDIQ